MFERDFKETEKLRAERESADAIRKLRDSDVQLEHVSYEIGRHALETLAMRYGIAHLVRDQSGKIRDGSTILIRKTHVIESDKFRAVLPEYRDREVVVIIRKGEDFVRTFYPISSHWFKRNKDWELIIKGNPSWSLKEIARMHVDRINRSVPPSA